MQSSFLAIIIWHAFSLALVITILARAAIAQRDIDSANPASDMDTRSFALFAFVGLFGTAVMGGSAPGMTAEAITATFAGAAAGIFVGHRAFRRP